MAIENWVKIANKRTANSNITCSWVIQYLNSYHTAGAQTHTHTYCRIHTPMNALFDPNWKPTLINYLKIMYTNYALNGWRTQDPTGKNQ